MPAPPGPAPAYPMAASVDLDPVIEPHPEVDNPVLTPADVTDREQPTGVADPFLVVSEDTYHMFFEVLAGDTPTRPGIEDEVIGHARSDDGLDWEYTGVVLDDPGHLAFPHVFEHDGTWYLVPDGGSGDDKHFYGGIARVYRATSFPTEWELVDRPLMRMGMSDPVVFQYEGTWYLVGGLSVSEERYSGLCLYYAESLRNAPWQEHPASPIHAPTVPATEPDRIARPGGRPIVHDDHVDLFVQDCVDRYGDKVRVVRITELSPTTYVDHELACSPVIEATEAGDWRDELTHHVDAGLAYAGAKNLVGVDGKRGETLSIGLYHLV